MCCRAPLKVGHREFVSELLSGPWTQNFSLQLRLVAIVVPQIGFYGQLLRSLRMASLLGAEGAGTVSLHAPPQPRFDDFTYTPGRMPSCRNRFGRQPLLMPPQIYQRTHTVKERVATPSTQKAMNSAKCGQMSGALEMSWNRLHRHDCKDHMPAVACTRQ